MQQSRVQKVTHECVISQLNTSMLDMMTHFKQRRAPWKFLNRSIEIGLQKLKVVVKRPHGRVTVKNSSFMERHHSLMG